MADTNVVCLVCRLTRDADIRTTKTGTEVANIRVAFTTRVKTGDEWGDKSNYADIVVWRVGGLAQYLEKGRRIGITGRLEWDEWQDKDGATRQRLQIVADQVQLLDTRDRQPQGVNDLPTGGGSSHTPDDIPFAVSI